MPRPTRSSLALAERYRLGALVRPTRGRIGERAGQGTGGSLEFQDRRAYTPGDDVRHLDWSALARTDQLLVRLYRDEVRTRLELYLDASRSMAIDEQKAERALELAALIGGAARRDGVELRLWALGDRPERVEWSAFAEAGVELEGRRPPGACLDELRGELGPGALRVVVSDFLAPEDPGALVRKLGLRAGGLVLVQLYGAADLAPPSEGALTLEDAESGEQLPLVLSPRVVELYEGRRRQIEASLAEGARELGGTYVQVDSGEAVEAVARNILVPSGVLEPG